jgi:hypothetical protein
MPLAERRERWQAMMEFCTRNHAKAWRESSLHSLAQIFSSAEAAPGRVLRLPPAVGPGRLHRSRPVTVRSSLAASNQSNPDLPANREPSRLLIGHTKDRFSLLLGGDTLRSVIHTIPRLAAGQQRVI